jgi:putative ABC transport system substrate-binding protein
MRRRDFLSLMGCAASWPLAARAQQKPTPVIGILDNAPGAAAIYDGFVQGMRDLGYVEGRNVAYARRASPDPGAMPALAAELVEARVDIIVTAGPPGIRAASRATNTIPIVFLAMGDPVSAGMVASLAHPGGHLTGLSFLNDDLSAKRLDLLRQLVPNLRAVATFYAGGPENKPLSLTVTERTAQKLGLELQEWPLRTVEAIEPAFEAAAAAHVGAVDVLANPFFNENRERLAELAAKYRLPAIYESGEYVRSGCLMAYGPVFADMGRRGAAFVDKILHGANPGDLPVEVATKFALTINLKAAKALGLDVPPSLLAGAAEVIE